VDAGWARLCEAVSLLLDLVVLIREQGSPLARPEQQEIRERAAAAMAAIGLDRYEHRGVRLVLVPARVSFCGGEYVVIATSYVRVSLDPMTARTLRLRQAMMAKGGATVVDFLERRAARERVA